MCIYVFVLYLFICRLSIIHSPIICASNLSIYDNVLGRFMYSSYEFLVSDNDYI
jgi:hypothetical protein